MTGSNVYNVTCSTLPNGDMLIYGRHQMQMTTSGSIRHAVFNIPVLANTASTNPKTPATPNVQVTIFPTNPQSGPALILLNLQVTPGSNATDHWLRIDIDAKTPNDAETNATYDCNIMVTGTLAASTSTRKR